MANLLSNLFGKKKTETNPDKTSSVPPYPSSMIHPDAEEDSAYTKAIFTYYQQFRESAGNTIEPDAEMEAYYRDKVADTAKRTVFGNRYSNMEGILKALSEKIPNTALSRTDYLDMLLMFYISVFSRALIMDPFQTRESLVHRYPDLPEDLVSDCTAESLAYLCCSNERISDQILGRLSLKTMIEENSSENAGNEERFLNDPKYGLVPEKPVFLNGFGPHHVYLDALCTPEGIPLKNDRRGSMVVSGISGPVDVYDLFLPDGKKYMTIYLCLYGRKNAMRAPEGLCFVKS